MENRGGQRKKFSNLRTADGLFTVDQQMRITSWNESASQLLGYEAEEVLGKKCYEVLCQPGSPGRSSCNRQCKVVTNARRGRPTRDFDLSCTNSDGEEVWLNITAMFETPFNNGGEVVHFFRDVTERRGVEKAAVQPPAGQSPERPVRPPVKITLSTREDQVLRLLYAGKNTNEIADVLGVKPVTARNHITRLMNRVGATTRLQAVAFAVRNGLI